MSSSNRLKVNPSAKELSDLYLPAHNEVGDQDWLTNKVLLSNQKQRPNILVGGVETRGSHQVSAVSANIRRQRQSVETRPSID